MMHQSIDHNKRTVEELSLLGLVTALFFTFMTVGLPLSVLPIYIHNELGLSNLWVGVAIGLQFIATVATRGYAGRLADLKGAKRTVLQGMFFCSLAGGAYLLAMLSGLPAWHQYLIILAGRLLLGIGESQIMTGTVTWGFGLMGESRSGKVMSWNGIACYGALTIGAPLGLWLATQVNILAVAILATVLPWFALLFNGFIRGIPANRGNPLSFWHVLKYVWQPGAALAMQGVGFATINTFASLYFLSHQWENAGLAMTCFGAGFLTVRLLFGHLPDKMGGITVTIVGLCVELSGQFLLAFAAHEYVALFGAIMTGLGCSLIFPALGVEVVKQVPPHVRGMAIGGFAAFQDVAYGITGPLTGVVATAYGYEAVFMVGAVCCVLGIFVTWRFHRHMVAQAEKRTSEAQDNH